MNNALSQYVTNSLLSIIRVIQSLFTGEICVATNYDDLLSCKVLIKY